jgi:hypothetical protein
MKTKLLQNSKSIILALILTLCVGYVSASSTYTGPNSPTATAPGNNTDAPLNIGTGLQTKDGNLWIKGLLPNPPGGTATYGLVVDGKVGIGTGNTAPAAKLDVIGNIKITDGTQKAGYVLTSIDGSGLASWQAASGGGSTSLNQNNCAWTTNTCSTVSGSGGAINAPFLALCPVGTYMAGNRTTVCNLSSCSNDYCISIGQKVDSYCCNF